MNRYPPQEHPFGQAWVSISQMKTPSIPKTLHGLHTVGRRAFLVALQLHLECSSKGIFTGDDTTGNGRGYNSGSIGRVAQIGTGICSWEMAGIPRALETSGHLGITLRIHILQKSLKNLPTSTVTFALASSLCASEQPPRSFRYASACFQHRRLAIFRTHPLSSSALAADMGYDCMSFDTSCLSA
jgi:hypothetical protein